MVVLAGVYFVPLLQSHSEQDACTFGTVSNARYQELLAEARRRQSNEWPPLVWGNKESMRLLNERVDSLFEGKRSVNETIAAAHAVMRALGGEFRRFRSDSESTIRADMGTVSNDYLLDVNRIGYFALWQRRAWIIGTVVVGKKVDANRLQDKKRTATGDANFIVWFPSWIDPIPPIEKGNSTCPGTPVVSANP